MKTKIFKKTTKTIASFSDLDGKETEKSTSWLHRKTKICQCYGFFSCIDKKSPLSLPRWMPSKNESYCKFKFKNKYSINKHSHEKEVLS